jgi:hypothetical protein
MSKSGDTTTTSSSSSLPSWFEPYAKDMLAKAKDVTEEPYQAYSGQRLADFSPDTNTAFGLIRSNANGGAPALDAGRLPHFGAITEMEDGNPLIREHATESVTERSENADGGAVGEDVPDQVIQRIRRRRRVGDDHRAVEADVAGGDAAGLPVGRQGVRAGGHHSHVALGQGRRARAAASGKLCLVAGVLLAERIQARRYLKERVAQALDLKLVFLDAL